MFLHRIYNGETPYKMDCSLFAQLGSLVLSNQWPKKKGDILLFVANTELSTFMLWSDKIPEMSYISVTDSKVGNSLQKSSLIVKIIIDSKKSSLIVKNHH